MPNDGTTPPLGTRIGNRYEVLDQRGDGSAGSVYRVMDHHLRQEMALKLLHPQKNQVATWDEAQLLKGLESPYLVQVFNADVDRDADLRYITMPLIAGGDLEKKTKDFGCTPTQAIKWAVDISHGLHRIHSAGMVHRDVKPANCFLGDTGGGLLGDLGMTTRVDQNGQAAMNGTIVTLAPEALANGGTCNIATDIYSLAATVFFLLCGRYPVDNSGSYEQTFFRVKKGERRRIRDLAPHVSQAVGTVVERALSLDPGDRPISALEFANLLGQARNYSRKWNLVSDHSYHLLCLFGHPHRLRRGITICTVQAGSLCDVEVRHESGRRIKRFEKEGMKFDQALTHIRQVVAKN